MNRKEAEDLLQGGRQGIEEWNLRRERGDAIPDLEGIDLGQVNLQGVNLSCARIVEGWFTETNLEHANFRQAILNGAQFSGTRAQNACFVGADLKHANFGVDLYPPADLSKANFSYAQLSCADFYGAELGGARFIGAHLRDTALLEELRSRARVEEAAQPKPVLKMPRPFGSWLEERTSALGWTQEDLARRLEIGAAQVRLWSVKSSCPRPDLVIRLVRLLGAPNEEIPGMPALLSSKCRCCGEENERGSWSCGNCGRSLSNWATCLDCGSLNAPGTRSCTRCDGSLGDDGP